MFEFLLLFLRCLFAGFRSHSGLVLENLALRHQLVVLKLQARKPKLRCADRLLWVGLRCIWPYWQKALLLFQPKTIIAWGSVAARHVSFLLTSMSRHVRVPAAVPLASGSGRSGSYFEQRTALATPRMREIARAPRGPGILSWSSPGQYPDERWGATGERFVLGGTHRGATGAAFGLRSRTLTKAFKGVEEWPQRPPIIPGKMGLSLV